MCRYLQGLESEQAVQRDITILIGGPLARALIPGPRPSQPRIAPRCESPTSRLPTRRFLHATDSPQLIRAGTQGRHPGLAERAMHPALPQLLA